MYSQISSYGMVIDGRNVVFELDVWRVFSSDIVEFPHMAFVLKLVV